MRNKIGGIRLFVGFMVLGAGVFLFGRGTDRAESKTVVSGYDSLKKELELPGKKRIKIDGNIRIAGPIYVKGEKILEGKGNLLVRETSKRNVYRGSLFIVNGSRLTVKGLVISGGGKSKYLKGGVSGRLVEVKNGKFILGRRGVLKNNINDKAAMSGGGAVLVQESGRFYMNGGEISANKSVMGGAGVRIEAQGLFSMTGGKIAGNQTVGVGAVEGFDGRGGAIYNEGQVKISGGTVCNNVVKKYSAKRHEYGGVGGMIYNRGKCVITGGTITDNKASSGGGAIYSDTQSLLRISGGLIRRNRADKGGELYGAEGICYLSGSPVLGSMYLKRGFMLKAERGLRIKQKILLLPEKYVKAWCIVRGGGRKDFSLVKKKHWLLRQGKQGLFLGRRRSKRKPAKLPMMPVLKQTGNLLQFYEGEYVGEHVLRFGITATDEKDGNLAKKVEISKIAYPDGKIKKSPDRLDTTKMGVGSIYYKVVNSRGYGSKLKASYRVLKNKKAVIRMSPRYLFAWEVRKYSPERWKEVLLANCRLEDDCETEDELQRDMKIEWNGLTANRAGRYLVCISIRDQWGHRYYMAKERTGRYGRGKISRIQIPVTLVAGNHTGIDTSERYVRFFSQSSFSGGESETWYFKRTDIIRIKQYMAKQINPFSSESNGEFLKRFRYCYKGKEETKGGEK